MAVAFVQSNSSAGGVASSQSLAFISPTTDGDLLICVVTNGGNGAIPTISDDAAGGGNSWVELFDNTTEDGFHQTFWYAPNSKSCTTITVSWVSGAVYSGLGIAEYSGVALTSPVDQTNSNTGTGSVWNTNDITVSEPLELIVAFASIGGTGVGINSPFTQRALVPDSFIFGDDIGVISGTLEATGAGSGSFLGFIASFFPFSAAIKTDAHNADCYIEIVPSHQHSADCYIYQPAFSHEADCYITGGIFPPAHEHLADVYIQVLGSSYVDLGTFLISPIKPNAYLKLESNLAQPILSFVQLGTNLQADGSNFVQLGTLLAENTRSYLKLKTNLMLGGIPTHHADAFIAIGDQLQFVQLGTNLVQTLVGDTECGGQFPDISFLNLSTWLVQAGESIQAPGTGLSPEADWFSSNDALSAYQTVGRFILNKIALIVTGFTTGVISYQTRTRQWLRRVDADPGGVVISTATSKRVLPNGQTINTVTTTTQVQDVTIVQTVTTYSSSPRVTKTITQTNKFGNQVRQEIETDLTNGIQHTQERKIVQTVAPPTTENVQPITVTTLDGVKHYQFFGAINPNWPGGDAEGTTVTDTQTQVVPSSFGGSPVDSEGNQIYARQSTALVSTPDGKQISTFTEEIGVPGVGTTGISTETQWNGLQVTVNQVTTNPDGSQTVKNTVTNLVTGNSVETTTEQLTDENGLVTTTTTIVETIISTGPGGIPQQTVTTTKTVAGPSGTTTETDTTTNNNFEDDIVAQKIKVYFIQEFTINCVIDRFSMEALLEKQIDHQKNFAIVELIGQQLGNANLSWPLRQNLINQFNQAMSCIDSLQLQALGKTYNVVFAPSAASFRAKYIPGTMPAAFELQMIVQERSDLVTGLAGF